MEEGDLSSAAATWLRWAVPWPGAAQAARVLRDWDRQSPDWGEGCHRRVSRGGVTPGGGSGREKEGPGRRKRRSIVMHRPNGSITPCHPHHCPDLRSPSGGASGSRSRLRHCHAKGTCAQHGAAEQGHNRLVRGLGAISATSACFSACSTRCCFWGGRACQDGTA